MAALSCILFYEEDYSKMRQMFYDDVPEMSSIISRLKTLETELNTLEAES